MERKANRRLKLSEKQWICQRKRDFPGLSFSRIASNVLQKFGINVSKECVRQTLSKESEIMAAKVDEPYIFRIYSKMPSKIFSKYVS